MAKPRLKLILAVSSDGFLATGPADGMFWTGAADKFLFKLLTTDGQPLLAGHTTAYAMPKLAKRQIFPLSRDAGRGSSLEQKAYVYPDAWLIGGPTVAEKALRLGLVHRAYISHTKALLSSGIPFQPIQDLLPQELLWQDGLVGDVNLKVYWGLNGPLLDGK